MCPWWKLGTCRWGARCKWLHEGPAGIATVAKQHQPRGKKTNKKSSVNAAHELRTIHLELLACIATSLDSSVLECLTKLCGRLQIPRNCLKMTHNRKAVFVGSQSQSVNHSYRRTLSKSRGNCGSRRPNASLVRADSVLSDHPDLKSSVRPDSDPRSRHSAPCDIKAGIGMVSSKINLDISFNKTSLLQESHCLNSKIIKDNDVEVPEVHVKVFGVDVQGVVDFIEVRLHQGVGAAHTHTVPVVKPLAAAHQVLCQSQKCDGEVSASVPDSSVVCLGNMMPSDLASVWETAVVGDTGATVAIIGEHHVHLAENIRILDVPMSISTASGIIELTHAGDLPGCFGLMDGVY